MSDRITRALLIVALPVLGRHTAVHEELTAGDERPYSPAPRERL